ncbi:hypothetical protein [Fibrella forsythiae]|uniref:DUF5117 domain-containing protein n=1 Tax=Fibrella forsythiae TaxID=2817061 RepID=A0ABS3JMW4_9BACT|nr:hypothetical protein [Fibrella forsythiae]MBO0951333.1 hypothetical protein [Fibrella forsythiae]
MKKIISFCLISLLTISGHFAYGQAGTSQKATDVLRLVLTRLQAIRHVSYTYYRDVNYVSESYRNELSGTTFIDFQAPKNELGFGFQLDSDTYKQVYDGAVYFMLNKKEKTMDVQKQPKRNDFASFSFFVNSPVSLRTALAAIIADETVAKTLRDTLVGSDPCQLVRFTLPSKTIGNLGSLTSLTTQRSIIYSLYIRTKDHLPVQVIQTNNITPTDYVLTRFSNYIIDGVRPEANTWHYFMHVNEYRATIHN